MASSSESVPAYSSAVARRQRSKELAQKRRTTYKGIMDDLTQALPFPKDVVSQLDYNSRLRLALCFFRLKALVDSNPQSPNVDDMKQDDTMSVTDVSVSGKGGLGLMQDFFNEALDGFLVVALTDGTITFLSESIHKHLGLFQSEHIGISLYELILEGDHESVRTSIHKAELTALARLGHSATAEIGFFCRMKCSRFKVTNTISKTPGYKLVYISGSLKVSGNDTYLIVIARPVSPPSIMEIKVEGNMFVTHYSMEMKCTFFDGRLFPLMGYQKEDLLGDVVFTLHHHEDTDATMECSRGVMSRGEGLSGYFRFLTANGFYLWLQTRATVMHDSRTGKPSYILCMNFVINKELGDDALKNNATISAAVSKRNNPAIQEIDARAHDPFPLVSREDGKQVNPLAIDESKIGEIKNESEVTSSSSDGQSLQSDPSVLSPDVSFADSTICEPDSSCPDLGLVRTKSSDAGYVSRGSSGNEILSPESQISSSSSGNGRNSSPENPPSVFRIPPGVVLQAVSNTHHVSSVPSQVPMYNQPQVFDGNGTDVFSVGAGGTPQLSAMLSGTQQLQHSYHDNHGSSLGKQQYPSVKQEDVIIQLADYSSASFRSANIPNQPNYPLMNNSQSYAPQGGGSISNPPVGDGHCFNGSFQQSNSHNVSYGGHDFLPDWSDQNKVKTEYNFSHISEILPIGFQSGLAAPYSNMPTQQFSNVPAQQFSNMPSQQFSNVPTQQDGQLPLLTGEDLKILDDIGIGF